MAKFRKPYRNGRNRGAFVSLPHSVIDSPRFRALSSAGVKVVLAIARLYNGSNNGAIAFSERGGEGWGLSQKTTRRALREAQEASLITKTQCGAFTTKRLAALWAISWQPLPAGVAVITPQEVIPSGRNAPPRGKDGRYARHTPGKNSGMAVESTAVGRKREAA